MWLYNIVVRFYALAVACSGWALPKARLWRKGRKGWKARLGKVFEGEERPRIWVHCSSLGEFEQGRPLIETIRQAHPGYCILLTFFSPSGYTVRKNYPHADHVDYMPLDTAANAAAFLGIVRPSLAVFVKYEFWLHHLNLLADKEVPTVLISARFRPDQIFFRSYGGIFRRVLPDYRRIFVQDSTSYELLRSLSLDNVELAGDTRVDRVTGMVDEGLEIREAEEFTQDTRTLIFASIWQQDEPVFVPFIRQNIGRFRFIIAPHEVDQVTVDRYCSIFENQHILLSRFQGYDPDRHRVLIVDSIGQLAYLYRYADLAYVGGAFGHGLHNILEPAASGLPVVFGPRYKKFTEALELVGRKAAVSIDQPADFEEASETIWERRAEVKTELEGYLNANRGATEKIFGYLSSQNLL